MTQITSGHPQTTSEFGSRQRGIRLQNPATGLYLHVTGAGETQGTLWSWFGTWAQAATLRRNARSSGVPFPYIEVQP